MADLIKVDLMALEQDIKGMQEILEQIDQKMKSMYESVTELGKTWEGTAHTAFVKQFEKDAKMFGEVEMIVKRILESMEESGKEYRSCEQKIRAEIQGIKLV